MKKTMIAILIAATVGAAFWTFGRNGHTELSYRFVTVEQGDLHSVVSSTGTLEAVTTVSVGTQVSGIIAEIFADFNDEVEEGEVIARLDTTLLETAVQEATAALARNRAELRQAERDYERIRSLFDDQIVAQSNLDQVEYALDVARANSESAAVGLAKAQQNLAYATISSPISGTVIERTVDVGQTVAASLAAPELFRIAADLSRLQILAAVDESDIGEVHAGQAVQFTVQAHPEETFTGTVRQVRLQSQTQENVVNYTVVIDVDNEERKLLPGMTATAEFLVASAEDVLKVSNAALRFRPTEAMIAELRSRREQAPDRPGRPGPPAPPDGAPAGGQAADRTTLWYLDAGGQLAVMPVRTGISDGQMTAIEGPRAEAGIEVIVGVTQGSPKSTNNPFQLQAQEPSGPPRTPGL